jgi:Zn-dependent protease/predicted transcriptional regulator
MKSWSLHIGKYLGIDVYIHWTFWILVLWIVLSHIGGGESLGQALQGVLFILALFVCVVLHEFGHALTARRFGIATRDVTLYPIGGVSSLEKLPDDPRQELLVAIAGPVVNLIIAGLLWVILNATGQPFDLAKISGAKDVTEIPFLWGLFYANLMLPIFNLIPAFPMDGGRALRALLSMFTGRLNATRIAALIGQFLAVAFVFLGFFFNFWLVFIGLFIFLGASGETAMEQTKMALGSLTVRAALMRQFTAFSPHSTLGEASEALLNGQDTTFVVLDNGEPIGLLTVNEIVKGLAESGTRVQVSAFMKRDFLTVNPDVKLFDLLMELTEKGETAAVVVEGDSHVGLIDRQNLQERIMIEQALHSRK